MKIKDVAALIEGIVEGDADTEITGLGGIDSAKHNDLTFAVTENNLASAEKSAASCVLTDKVVRKSTKPLIRVKNPKLAFLMLYNKFHTADVRKAFIHPTASVSIKAKVGNNVWIGPGVIIEDGVTIDDNTIVEANTVIKKNSEIGASCRIYPNVTLYENVKIKKHVTLHAGVVVGADGFGYVKEGDNIYKFPQLGGVIIEENVEVGANTTIDRGSLNDTVIKAGAKIDNLCQIAHNVKIGKNALIAAQSGISGSSRIGDNVMIGGQAGLSDNITIGDNVMIAAKSGVIGNIEKNTAVWGIPARPIAQTKRQMAVLSWLTKNFKSISKNVK